MIDRIDVITELAFRSVFKKTERQTARQKAISLAIFVRHMLLTCDAVVVAFDTPPPVEEEEVTWRWWLSGPHPVPHSPALASAGSGVAILVVVILVEVVVVSSSWALSSYKMSLMRQNLSLNSTAARGGRCNGGGEI